MKKYFLFIFLFFTSLSFSQEIIGTWDFDYILADSIESVENLKPISDGDLMQINEDGSFYYEIADADLIADGTWYLEGSNLSFNYTLPKEMTRFYQISISENSLILNENSVNYAFTKSEIILEEIVTSGITINSISRGILGIISLLLIAFLFSRNRKGIDWMLVAKGLGIQIVFALLILKVSFVSSSFEFVGKIFTKIISFTQDGTMFLFKSFETGIIESPLMNFVVMILPTVIFFSALTSLFYYWRIIPKIVYGFAWMMKSTMGLSGPESVAAAGNIFLGQTESPLLVKPYLDKMTMSEMMCLMSGGMATIAGGVLAAYIGFLGEDDPVQQIMFAKHLLAASVMSAPAAVVAAKILLPEKEAFETKLEVSKADMGSNALEAISKGTTDGLRLAVNVGAMLLVFIGLMSMANFILFKVGDWTTLNTLIENNTHYSKLSFNMILGYIGAPIVWLMGVCREDMFLVGQLLGEKTVLNEFVAYVSLGEMKNAGVFVEKKSIIIATYILCGFANFASIGIQIGGIGALAPKRKGDLASLGFLALIGGTLASLFTAVIVGMLI
ncbi:MAG: nucleoside transporter C-terminal domain-containing protein [Flavobacteriales bacterium]|nr:nucleoside transporter C-terminal domain-containing protein [Flavobacteriales bacterium]